MSEGQLSPQTETLTFGILGPLEVRTETQQVIIPGKTVRNLLSTLLLSPNEWVDESRLIDLAWGPKGATRTALYCAISRLRKCLTKDFPKESIIDHSDAGYQIRITPHQLDSMRFWQSFKSARAADEQETHLDELGRALKNWRGPALAHSSEWLRVDPKVLALERARIQCIYDLADLGLASGRPRKVLPLVELLAVDLPYDEPLQARLLMLKAAVGRRAEALRQYEELRQHLANELGVDPSAILRSAHLAVLTDRYPSGAQPIPLLPQRGPRPARRQTIRRSLIRFA